MSLDDQSKFLQLLSESVNNNVQFFLSLSQKAIDDKKDCVILMGYYNRVSSFGGITSKYISSNWLSFNTGNTTGGLYMTATIPFIWQLIP